MTAQHKRVAMVIGSGSVKCAAAIGAREVLSEAGIEVEMVVGCSAGAIYAALMAAGHDTASMKRNIATLWTKEVTSQRNRMAMLRSLAPRLLGFRAENFGMRDDRLILERLRRVFGDGRVEAQQIPLHITATDFTNGDLVVLSQGSMVDAIRASVALPFAFSPWRVDGRLLIDGFLADPLPISVAMKNGADVIVAIGFESPYQESVRSAGRFAFQLSAIMSNNLLRSRFAFHSLAHHSEVIAILPEFKERVRLFDVDKLDYVIEEGRRAAQEQLPYLRELLGARQASSVAAQAGGPTT
jgi:NTE family protein